jgi:hypothetical protein
MLEIFWTSPAEPPVTLRVVPKVLLPLILCWMCYCCDLWLLQADLVMVALLLCFIIMLQLLVVAKKLLFLLSAFI